jgi:cobalamin biosynthesis protein CobT
MYSVRLGNKRVYTQEVEGMELNTAISVLIDTSGSMGCGSTSRSWYAKVAAIALAETFDALQIPFEMIGFESFDGFGYGKLPSHQQGKHNFRTLSMHYHVYKAFKDNYKKVAKRLADINGGEANNDGEAVLAVSKRLAARPEQRKILFVLSDGLPRGGCDRDVLEKHLAETVKRVVASGIEVVAIGIQTDEVKHFYNEQTGATWFAFHDLKALPNGIYNVMKAQLAKRTRKGRAA